MIAPTGGMTSDGLKKILGGGTCIAKKNPRKDRTKETFDERKSVATRAGKDL